MQSLLRQLTDPSSALSVVSQLEDRASLVESLLEGQATPADMRDPAPQHSSSKLATVIIVAKYCFGQAFLLMPYGCNITGLIGAPLLLIVVYMLMMWGVHALIESRKVRGPGCYADLGLVWGTRGQQCIHWCLVLTAFGFNCIWISSTVKFLGMLLPQWDQSLRLFVSMPLVALLTLVRHLKLFTVTNLLGVCVCVATFVFLLGYSGLKVANDGIQSSLLFNTSSVNYLHWLAQCGYTYEIIVAVMPIYEAAADKKSVPVIIYTVSGIWTILCISMGCMGFLAFGEDTQVLAIQNLSQASVAGQTFSALFGLVGVFTQPVNNFIICLSYEPLCRWSSKPRMRKWMKNFVRWAVVLFTYVITYLGGAKLQFFVELVGGVLGMFIAIVMPCLLHIKICKPEGCTRIISYFTTAFGFVAMATSMYNTLSS